MTKQIFASRELYAFAREQCRKKPQIDRDSENLKGTNNWKYISPSRAKSLSFRNWPRILTPHGDEGEGGGNKKVNLVPLNRVCMQALLLIVSMSQKILLLLPFF